MVFFHTIEPESSDEYIPNNLFVRKDVILPNQQLRQALDLAV